MSPVVPLTPNGSNTLSGGLNCSVFLGFTGSEDMASSEKENNLGGKDGMDSVPKKKNISACSEREDSDSPSLIQNGALTEMGFAKDHDAVFINNNSFNMLNRMSNEQQFKSVLSINLDDIEQDT